MLSLTGSYAPLGEANRNAIQLEVDRINESGGVNGMPLELVVEDDGTDESKAVAAAQKLILQDGVIGIVGASGTGQSMAIRQVGEESGVPMISLAGGSVITDDFSPFQFQTPWPNRIVVAALMEHFSSEGIERVALVSDAGGFGKDGRAVVLEQAPQYDVEIVVDTTFNPGDTDMTGQVEAVRRSNADAVLVYNAGKEGSLFVKAMRTAGVDIPLYGSHGLAREEFIEGAGYAAEGFTLVAGRSYVGAWDPGSDQAELVDAFNAAYAGRYGIAPNSFAGYGWDGIRLMVEAVSQASVARGGGVPSSPEVLTALEGITGFAGYGGVFSFSATDHNGLSADDLTLISVRDGVFVAR